MINIKRGLHTSIRNDRIFRIHWWTYFKRWQELDRDVKVEAKEEQKLKSYFRPTDDMYITPEKRQHVMEKKALADQTRRDYGAMPMELVINHTTMRYVDHSIDNKNRVKRYEKFQVLPYDQRFVPERFLFLGADLAAAHFLVRRDAAVKFVGDDTWYSHKGKDLPRRRIETLRLEAIDASGTELIFEGFDNLYDLNHLRLLRLSDCEYVDDWTLSRLGSVFGQTLEYLDISNCKKVTGKGLMGLRSMTGLKELRLNGLIDQKGLCKSALLLESVLPNLQITGLDYAKALDEIEAEEKLLRDDRTLIDARGNVFIEDDEGGLYYVSGKISEKAVVNDEDQPLITSTIRQDLPVMDDIEFERLDRLTEGKLRHQLVGSPSGYIWSDQVNTILAHEAKLNKKRQIPTDSKMLPLEARLERFKELGIDIDRVLLEKSKHIQLEQREKLASIEGDSQKKAQLN